LKIGIGAGCYDRFGERKYEMLKAHGYECVDINMMGTDWPPYIDPIEQTEKKLLKEKALADNSGIEIYQVHGPWTWPPEPTDSTEEKRKEKLEHVKRSLWATAVLGCKNWVIHPIMPCGINDKQSGQQETTFNVNMEFLGRALEVAKSYDITICLENMPMQNFSLATPYEILDFVKKFGDPNFKICLDTGHVATFPNMPVGDCVRTLGDNIRAFHLHDSRQGFDLHLWPYFGAIDWNDFSKALKEIDYKGGICLETAPPHNVPDDIFCDLSQDLFKLVKNITAE
jgi:sugar phosphate isomerase/epimerase